MPQPVMMPDSAAYLEAVQNPALCFKDNTLKKAIADLDKLGLPRPISGAFACVFTLSEASRRRWAVKCFTKNVEDRRERYQEVSHALAAVAVPWKVHFEYQDSGILVQGKWWPVVKMEWFDAELLSGWVTRHQYEPDRLWRVAEQICSAVSDLERLGWSHGDLQHGNILVAPDDSIRLIDYDGMFVPALAGRKPTESGHLHYQHPKRGSQGFGPRLDRFSGWVIALGLAAIAHEPTLVDKNPDSKESILFRAEDYKAPVTSKMLRYVAQSPAAKPVGEAALRVLNANLQSLEAPTLQGLPKPKKGAATWAVPTTAAARSTKTGSTSTSTSNSWPPPPPKPAFSLPPTAPLGASAWLPQANGSAAVTAKASGAPGKYKKVVGTRFAWLLTLLAIGAGFTIWPYIGAIALSCWTVIAAIAWLRTPERKARRGARANVQHLRQSLEAAERQHARTLDSRSRLIGSLNEFYTEQIRTMDLARSLHQDEIKQIQAGLSKRFGEIEEKRLQATAKHRTDYEAAVRRHQETQLSAYLARHDVGSSGLTSSCVYELRRSGIRTAADFIGMRVESTSYGNGTRALMQFAGGQYRHVPTIGPVRAGQLVRWRDGLVRRAASTPDPAREKARLDQELRAANERLNQERAVAEASTSSQLLQPTRAMTDYNTRLAALRTRIANDQRTVVALDAQIASEDAAKRTGEKELSLAKQEAADGLRFTLPMFLRQATATASSNLLIRTVARLAVLAAVIGAVAPAVQEIVLITSSS
jgi:hypothetical protein